MTAKPGELLEHSFRHDAARLVAVLARRAGVRHLAEVEDAVQGALEAAVTTWATHGVPTDRAAWLFRVARNRLVSALRKEANAPPEVLDEAGEEPSAAFAAELRDEQLRMIFVCCDERLPAESRLVLALKVLCGFSTAEIAARLFTTEANVHKRLQRARARLREADFETATPPLDVLRARLGSVHSVLMLLFNEGHLSTHGEHAIRVELCDEALRLATLLALHPVGSDPETFALLATLHLHAARLPARRDASGGLLLLEEQDRAAWDQAHLEAGARWLERAGQGERLTRFHVEAAIAAHHCFAPSFAATPWNEIAGLYGVLERLDPSPLHTLNRAVALAEANGADSGLEALRGVTPPAWLEGHWLWAAVLADLHRRAGHADQHTAFRDQALAGAPSGPVRDVLARRLGSR